MAENVLTLMINKALPMQTGVSKTSGKEWRKQEFVGQTYEAYPKTVCFSLFGDSIEKNPVVVGGVYAVHFDVESRSFTGKDGKERWSTDIRAWKTEPTQIPQFTQGMQQPQQMQPQQPQPRQQQQTYQQPQYQQPQGYPQQQVYQQPVNPTPEPSLPF